MIKQQTISELKNITKLYKQDHLWKFWDELDTQRQDSLSEQIQSIDFALMRDLYNKYLNSHSFGAEQLNLKPTKDLISLRQRKDRDQQARAAGEEALRAGKVAIFLVAGGQGTRLGFPGPKGAFPITPVKEKTLFQLHAEKIRATEKRYQVEIPWYIMTSQTNHQATVDFFTKNNFFGLNSNQLIFFKQEMLPAFHENGKLLLSEKHKLSMSPNGHGGSIKALWDNGAIKDMTARKIEYLFYFQVDNVLTKICDPCFIGYHLLNKAEMSNKVVRKTFPEEKMGVIGLIDDKTCVIEYSDLSEKEMYATDESGELQYWAGSIAIHVINVDFIAELNRSGFKLPYHFTRKKIPFINKNGRHVNPEDKNGIKFESFVFDALKYARNPISIEVEREEEFSPVKNNEGVDSPLTARRDMVHLFSSWIEAAGLSFPDLKRRNEVFQVEISPLFALDKEEFIGKANQVEHIENDIYIE